VLVLRRGLQRNKRYNALYDDFNMQIMHRIEDRQCPTFKTISETAECEVSANKPRSETQLALL